MDHDQRFKILIREFFGDFLELFFRPWAERLDTTAVEWIDKEIFPDPPQGQRHVLDLVGKLPTRQPVPEQRPGIAEPPWLALVHIEIESPDRVKPLRPRMFDAYVHLRRQYELPVLPIGLYLRVGLDGIGIDAYEEHFWELETVRFQYLYVGLPALDAIQYVQGTNWLGVALAALMRIPRDQAAWLGAEALRRISEAPLTNQQRFLLGECVLAYLPLDDVQRDEFNRIITTEQYQGIQTMNTTWFEQGVEKGLQQGLEKGLEKGLEMGREKGFEMGREQGYRAALRESLEERFGPLAPVVVERLQQLPLERLIALNRAVVRAQSLGELGLED